MHETLQRKICRVAFLALCVLPTIGLAGSVGWRLWPGRHDAMLAALGRQLGGRLSAERISTPKPGLWRVEGLTLADPETAALIAQVDWLEFQHNGQTIGHGGEASVLQPAGAARTIHRLLRSDWPNDWRFAFRRVTLGKHKTASWQDIRATLSHVTGEGGRCRRFAISQPKGAANLHVDRQHNEPTPRSIVRLNTGNQTVAWAWVAALAGPTTDASKEAPAATFRGSAEATQTVDHATLSAAGTLANVQPATILGHNGLLLAAPMTVSLDQLQIISGRITNLRANAAAGPGTLEHTLILASIQQLGCRATTALQNLWPRQSDPGPFEPIAFDRLAFTLSLDASGCRLSGDALLASSAGPLLLAPTTPARVEALLHLAAPAAQRYHPASAGARKLANRLPLTAIE